jgi:hypothetical protein
VDKVRRKNLDGFKHYHIAPSRYPAINPLEWLVTPAEMEALAEIESMTNNRMREEMGETSVIPISERIKGAGTRFVMSSFTHIGNSSRFSDASYGVYYAGMSIKTALLENKYNREQFLALTNEPACVLEVSCYIGAVKSPLHDIRNKRYEQFQLPDSDSYTLCQSFSRKMKKVDSAGLYYKSIRHPGGECIAAFKPTAIGPVRQGKHYLYMWDGNSISTVLEVKSIL